MRLSLIRKATLHELEEYLYILKKAEMEREQREGSPLRHKEKVKKKTKAKIKQLASDYIMEGGALESFSLGTMNKRGGEDDSLECEGVKKDHSRRVEKSDIQDGE